MEEKQLHFTLAKILILGALAVSLGTGVAYVQKQVYVGTLEEQLRVSEKILGEYAVLTDRNDVDSTLLTILHDCERRNEYEALLNSLASLSKRDLITIQSLSESCGTFYADRKTLMVMRMEREFASYEQLLELRSTLAPRSQEYPVQKWRELINAEKKRGEILQEQVYIQEAIVTELIKGSSSQSKAVQDLVVAAREITEQMDVLDVQIDGLRGELLE